MCCLEPFIHDKTQYVGKFNVDNRMTDTYILCFFVLSY